MSDLNYMLVVLTHGDGKTLIRSLNSFIENMTLAPASVYVHVDGPTGSHPIGRIPSPALNTAVNIELVGQGFCAATAACWAEAAASDADYILWLEHDFMFLRPIDLAACAAVLKSGPRIAQVAFKRGPVNPREKAAGGVIEAFPDHAELFREFRAFGRPNVAWLEHSVFWTTNPSLFPTRIAREFPWPPGPECEGHIGASMREAGYRFAFHGGRADPPAVEHIGVRTGFGY